MAQHKLADTTAAGFETPHLRAAAGGASQAPAPSGLTGAPKAKKPKKAKKRKAGSVAGDAQGTEAQEAANGAGTPGGKKAKKAKKDGDVLGDKKARKRARQAADQTLRRDTPEDLRAAGDGAAPSEAAGPADAPAKKAKKSKKKLGKKGASPAKGAQAASGQQGNQADGTPRKKGKKGKKRSDSASAAYAKQANAKSHEASRRARVKSDGPRARDYSYTQNRELSWLRFDDRVLTEALTPEVPLFERLKFCAIFQSNLDEWFMIRIGGLSSLTELKTPPVDNKSGLTPTEQLDMIFGELPDLLGRQEEAFSAIERQLQRFGLTRVGREGFDDKDNVAVARYFERFLSPVLSPLVVDPRHPFPNLRNGQLYVMCGLDAGEEGELLGMVEVPASMPRVIELPSTTGTFRYALMEDVIAQGLVLSDSFNAYRPVSAAVVRVTRNADIDPDGEGVENEEDYRQHMKKILRRRMRLEPVRVELEGSLGPRLEELVREELGLAPMRVSRLSMPLDLSYVYGLESKLPARHRQALLFEPFEPQQSTMVEPTRPVREQVADHDVLLYYPYESMRPFLDLVAQAACDDDCISIRITLYRVATRSRLCESLITAAENGKDVTVLMELRARFDEKNNIEWAERLDQAGCTVIYGSEGFKCHSKICQITYHDKGGLTRITCLGTGNFNEKTARLYSDFLLMTADKGIGEDGNAFFRNLTLGNLRGSYHYLGVAPTSLKPLIMRGIEREIARARAGQPAKVFMKMNSLTDRDVIDKIAEATQAGVKMDLIVRGICCIKPGVPGKTEGLSVRQIVGRLLEHSRVYAFGADADTIYLSSADMMTRNTERRVEIAFPVLDPACRAMVIEYMDLQMSDNVKARQLTGAGTWSRVPAAPDAPLLDSQDVLIALAQHHARIHAADGRSLPLAPELASLPPDVIRRLVSLYSSYRLKVEPDPQPDAAAPALRQEPVAEDAFLAQQVTDGRVPLSQADQAVSANTAPPSGVPAYDGGIAQAAAPAAAGATGAGTLGSAAPATAADPAAIGSTAPQPAATPAGGPATPSAAGSAPSAPAASSTTSVPASAPAAPQASPGSTPEATSGSAPAGPATSPEEAGSYVEPDLVDGDKDASDQAQASLVPAKRSGNRLSAALHLIGLGLRTLVQGPEAAARAQASADRKNQQRQRKQQKRAERKARRDK